MCKKVSPSQQQINCNAWWQLPQVENSFEEKFWLETRCTRKVKLENSATYICLFQKSHTPYNLDICNLPVIRLNIN